MKRACHAVSWRLKLFDFHPGLVEPNNDNEEFAESKQQRKTFHYQLHGGARAFLLLMLRRLRVKSFKTLFFASLMLCFSFSFRVRCCVNKNKRNIHCWERKLNNVLEFNQNIFLCSSLCCSLRGVSWLPLKSKWKIMKTFCAQAQGILKEFNKQNNLIF